MQMNVKIRRMKKNDISQVRKVAQQVGIQHMRELFHVKFKIDF